MARGEAGGFFLDILERKTVLDDFAPVGSDMFGEPVGLDFAPKSIAYLVGDVLFIFEPAERRPSHHLPADSVNKP